MPEIELEVSNLKKAAIKNDLRIEWLKNELEAAENYKKDIEYLLEEAETKLKKTEMVSA